ncbi:MAG: hypothetical protein IT256_06505, partial [Chitinophagaceae bacterium]|nr:hypothetical protein [Chitinophagaceae bacterium]
MNIIRQLLFVIVSAILFQSAALAQTKYDEARSYLDTKNYQSAALIYKDLYVQMPEKEEVYQDYLYTLMTLKDFKKAEDIVKQQLKKNSNKALLYVDIGNVYAA